MISRPEALEYAGRLAASFPRTPIGKGTIAEWGEEFAGLEDGQAEITLDLLKALSDRPPSVREIRRCILTAKNRTVGFTKDESDNEGLNSPCLFCGQPVLNGPDAASRYDKDTERWINVHLACAEA